MVSCQLSGQTGNQIFQIAAAISHARNIGDQWAIPRNVYSVYQSTTLFDWLPEFSDRFFKLYREPKFQYYPIPVWKGSKMVLKGWFQSYLYHRGHTEYIREQLRMEPDPHHTGKVSIHVRRGDFLRWPKKFPVVTEDYIRQAMKMFGTSAEFVFFTDGPSWVEDTFPGYEIDDTPTNDPLTAIRRMSGCKHHIIANSSFSYWGATFNLSPDKIVIAPSESNWFGPANKVDTSKICPPEWIRIAY